MSQGFLQKQAKENNTLSGTSSDSTRLIVESVVEYKRGLTGWLKIIGWTTGQGLAKEVEYTITVPNFNNVIHDYCYATYTGEFILRVKTGTDGTGALKVKITCQVGNVPSDYRVLVELPCIY